MKKFYLTCFLGLFGFVFAIAQVINFADPNLKVVLTTIPTYDSTGNGSPDTVVDTNGDGEIQISEATVVDNLKFPHTQGIVDVTGLEAFSSLLNLKIYLSASSNPVDFSYMNSLENLLILKQVNAAPPSIKFDGNNNLMELEMLGGMDNVHLNNLPSLIYLRIDAEQIHGANHLILSNCPILDTVRLGSYGGQTISLTNLPALESFDFFSGPNHLLPAQLTTLDLSSLPSLRGLGIRNAPNLSYINFSNLTQLTDLYLTNVRLDSIDLSDSQLLDVLVWNNLTPNNLNSINLNDNTELEYLNLQGLNIQSLDLSRNINLINVLVLCEHLKQISFKNLQSDFEYVWDLSIPQWGNPELEKICIDPIDRVLFEQIAIDNNHSSAIINEFCAPVPGGFNNNVSGSFRFDANGICSAISSPAPYQAITVQTNLGLSTHYSNSSGQFHVPLHDGNFNLAPVIDPSGFFSVSPNPLNVTVNTTNPSISHDFCISSVGQLEDLEVFIVPISEARPGFDSEYQLVFKNNGNQPLNGNTTFSYDDSVIDLISTSLPPTTQSGGLLSWNFNGLQPFENREINVILNLNSPMESPALSGGEILDFNFTGSASSNEATPADNTMTLSQTVVNSFDPNDKTCLEGDTIDPTMIGEYIHYMIRFENTGTASAINVVVRDEIDETMYDVSSLVPLESSHDYYTRVNHDVVEFIFENIQLDFNDATNDGYVLFKIKTLDTLQVDDTVSNTAEIYFDFNFPIITDPATSTFTTLGIGDVERQDESIKAYPTPFNRQISISAEHPIELIEVYDLNGRMLRSINVIGSQTDVNMDGSSLASGSYFLHITTSHGEKTISSVKR